MALILDKTEQKIVDIIDAHRNEIIEFAKDIYTHADAGCRSSPLYATPCCSAC